MGGNVRHAPRVGKTPGRTRTALKNGGRLGYTARIVKKVTALLTVVALLLAAPAQAADEAPRGRGWLTGVGMGFTVAGLAGLGLGLAGALQVSDAGARIVAYQQDVGVPLYEEADTVKSLEERQAAGMTLMGVGFGIAGAGALGAILCFVLDRGERVQVGYAPGPGGGLFTVHARF